MPDLRLLIRVPTHAVQDVAARRVVVETAAGELGILPRHLDVVATLVPGLVIYERADGPAGNEACIAVDGGTLVKCGPKLFISTPAAVDSTDVDHVDEAVEHAFRQRRERERRARGAIEKLQTDVIRRFVESQHHE